MGYLISLFLGIIVGSFIGIIIYSKKNKKRKIKSINVIIQNTLSLSEFSQKFIQKGIKFAKSDNIFLSEIFFANNGNLAIKDYNIAIKFNKNSELIDYAFKTNPETNFGKIKKNKLDKNILTLTIELINPGDSFLLRLTYADTKKGSFRVFLKNEDVKNKIFDFQNAKIELGQLLSKNSFTFSNYSMIKSLRTFFKIINKHKHTNFD